MLNSIQAIRQANEKRGGNWFKPGVMRFFRSRVGDTVEPLPNGGALFISSEQFRGSNGYTYPRRYSIQMASPDGSIETVGDFQAYSSRSQALRMMRRLAEWCRQSANP